jgi:hypothetical protein
MKVGIKEFLRINWEEMDPMSFLSTLQEEARESEMTKVGWEAKRMKIMD